MKDEKSFQLVELASSCPGLMVTVKCSDLIDAFRLVVEEANLQKEQKDLESTEESYLTTDEVCKLLNVSPTTLWRWNKEDYLKPIKFGRKNRYKKSEIDDFLNKQN